MPIHPTERGNAPGPFHVDAECVCCSVCSTLAPAHFRPSDDDWGHIVYQQPATPAETALCRDAAASCPVESIHERG
jgi:ferredoxin